MSKKINFLLLLALILGFAACKEQPVIINQGNTSSEDSTYVATPESPQAKKVLAVELTGVRCPNCPEGGQKLEELSQQNNNAIISVGLHSGVLTRPLNKSGVKSKYDFRTEQGNAILNQIFGGDPGVKPAVSFNRLSISGNQNPYFIQNYAQNWGPKLQEALNKENPVLINLSVHSKYNQSSGKYDIRVKVAYNKEITGKEKLNLYLTEDSIIDVQQTSDPFHEFDTNYVFNHVFRHAITGVSGVPILDSIETKEAGRVLIYKTAYTLSPPAGQTWVADNLNIAAFVSENADNDIHVYQAAETPLKGN